MNENRSRTEREPIEKQSRSDREAIEKRTENDAENIPSDLLGGLQYSFIVNIFSGVNKIDFGTYPYRQKTNKIM